MGIAPVASATCVWMMQYRRSKSRFWFSEQHKGGISVLPTCSEQPEGQHLVGSWTWPALQSPAGLSHGTVHHGLASQWSETAEFLESHEHLSVEKTRVEKQAGVWKKWDDRHRKNATSKAWAFLKNIHPLATAISIQTVGELSHKCSASSKVTYQLVSKPYNKNEQFSARLVRNFHQQDRCSSLYLSTRLLENCGLKLHAVITEQVSSKAMNI